MKKTFIIFLLFSINQIFSQSLSIELSIQWRKDNQKLFDNVSIEFYPILNITYRNSSNTPYYFKKISENTFGIPPIPWSSLAWNANSIFENAIEYQNYSGKKFKVIIDGDPYRIMGWQVIYDTVNYYQDHSLEIINDDLADIYFYVFQKQDFKNCKDSVTSSAYKTNEITEKGILTSLKDDFVFLKSEEIFIESYNLIGFNMVNGDFEFQIINDSLLGYVYTEPSWDKEKEMWVYGQAKLPAKVGEYQLFSGNFNTNSVKVKFGNIE